MFILLMMLGLAMFVAGLVTQKDSKLMLIIAGLLLTVIGTIKYLPNGALGVIHYAACILFMAVGAIVILYALISKKESKLSLIAVGALSVLAGFMLW